MGRRFLGALIVPLAALALGPSAAAKGTYPDPTGDASGAPDISTVTVSSTNFGLVTINVNLDSVPPANDLGVLLFIDTDLNPATGDTGYRGAEYLLIANLTTRETGFFRWDGSSFAVDADPTAGFTFGPNEVAFSFNKSALNNTNAFAFWVGTSVGDFTIAQGDNAPDSGEWSYSLAAGGPDIAGVIVKTLPARGPIAAKRFTITVTGLQILPSSTSIPPPPPDSYSCRGILGGKALKGMGEGGCTFKIPNRARGRPLVVFATVHYLGGTARFRSAYVVR